LGAAPVNSAEDCAGLNCVSGRKGEISVVFEITYRREEGSEKWHFCKNCSTWPNSDYIEITAPQHTLTGSLCLECITKRHFGECQVSLAFKSN